MAPRKMATARCQPASATALAALGVSDAERTRWLKAAWLHDAVRDEDRTAAVAHGPRAAARAEKDGERDRGVLDAIRYHRKPRRHRCGCAVMI